MSFVKLTPIPQKNDLGLLAPSWPERAAAVASALPWLAADYVLKQIKDRLPGTGPTRSYLQSLEVVRVRGGAEGTYTFAVRSNPKSRGAKKLSTRRSLLYVHPKRDRMSRAKKEILILEKYNPWTLETLPFTPDPKRSIVVTRNARAATVGRIAKKRRDQQLEWSRELRAEGIRPKRSNKLKVLKGVQTIPDIAMEALKLEFGLGGVKPTPHWRVSVQSLLTTGMKGFVKDKKHVIFPLTEVSDSLWKRWPPPTKNSISMSEVRSYDAFVKRLAVRA